MGTFVLHLHSATQYERIPDVASFVADDTSGRFGILAGHARMLACLKFGLACFRLADNSCEYLALPGGIVYFADNQLRLSTRRYLRHPDRESVSAALRDQISAEENNLREIKDGLARLERNMLKQLWATAQRGESVL